MFSQTSVTIDEYGAYFIDNGVLKRISTTENLQGGFFWRNYIVFMVGSHNLFYNMDNGASSEVLTGGDTNASNINQAGFFPLKNNNTNLIIYYNRMEYELDPVTLRTLSIREWGRNEYLDDFYTRHDLLEGWEEWQWLKWDSIASGYRFYGETDYVDIILSPNLIDAFQKEIILGGGKDNKFYFIIYDRYYDGK